MQNHRRIQVILVLAAAFLCGCERPEANKPAAEQKTNVLVVHPHRGEIEHCVTLPAELQAWQQAILYAKVAGYLQFINVDKGDRVKQGDILAQVEVPELIADLPKYQAIVADTRILYDRLHKAQAKSSDLVMPQSVDDAKANYDKAEAELKRIETLLAYTKVIAPFSGVITARFVDPGAFIPAATSGSVSLSTAVVTVMDFSTIRVYVMVPELEVPLIRTGLTTRMAVKELPGRVFEGKITRFAYALDDSAKTMLVEIDLPNPNDVLRPGMYAEVTICLKRDTGALLIPFDALTMEKTREYVFVVRAGKAKEIGVKTGIADETSVEVVEGLEPKDSVIMIHKTPASDGQPVNPMESK